jgi:hypothetical protein
MQRAEPPTQDLAHPGRRTVPMPPPPTPRAQFARVVVAAGAAVLLGAGPAVAWDLSTQPPRAEPRSPWGHPSPWVSAGKQMKAAAGGIARVYLPHDKAVPPEEADLATSPTASTATAATTPPIAPVMIAPPVYKGR